MRSMKKYDNKNPLFFLFTCVKDGKAYINKLFDSLLSQTKVNFVHYIYEDGSSDPVEDLVDTYKEKVSKLEHPYKVVYEKNPTNIGLNMSTKHCIDMCCCPYFIWIDCDNWVDKNFFKELEKLYLKHKNSVMLRSYLYNGSTNNMQSFSSTDIKNINSKYPFGMLLRRKYYYSFFAVNYKFYKQINKNNIMLDKRSFYNDEQILFLILSNTNKSCINKNAIGYFTVRDDMESKHYAPSQNEIRDYCLELASRIDKGFLVSTSAYFDILNLYRKLNESVQNNLDESNSIIKKIKQISHDYRIDLHNYYDHSLIKWKFRIIKRKLARQ